MKNLFLSALLLLTGFGLRAQVLYENFEGGTANLTWQAFDGTYAGVIANPGPDAVNSSAFVGSYTKAAGFSYSLFGVPALPQPLNLKQSNQFKLKVWSTSATPVLLKFEGTSPAIEKTVTMPAANQWVELTFDMSAGELATGYTKIFIFFDPGNDLSSNTYYFDDLRAIPPPVYETFESPSGITWSDINGTYNGAIPNPGPDAVNSSATVGSFSNNPAFDYNFAKGVLSAPIDISLYNQFKVKLWAPKPTQLLFKLEGGGNGIERTRNVAVTNRWQEYTFDLSDGAAYIGLNTILMVYSPGVTGSMDTFYVDDIRAVSKGACAGVTPDPDVIDDFDCNRNATYAGDLDSLSVILNPAPSVDNNSPRVGRYADVAGNGTEYAALVIDYENAINLSVRNQFSLKLWAPKAGNLLLKIEGGVGNKEVAVPVTEINKWVEYSVDFSDQVDKGHKKLVIFFNAGQNGAPGDVYYIDDIKLKASAVVPPLEDFQGGVHLGWQPLDQNNPLHGNFSAPTANTTPNTVNSSTEVGCYSKGASPFSTLQAFAPAAFDLSTLSQFNLDVLSPAGGGTVTFQLSSATQGNKEAVATITTPGAWETLSFDFSAFDAITDFQEIRLIFNAGTAAAGQSWCIDNLRQVATSVNPCLGVVAIPQIIDDFECQRNHTSIFYGAADLKVVNNPNQTNNPSLKVGEYKDPAGAGTGYEGIGYEFAAAPDLSLYNQLQVQVYAPFDNVPVLFKIQGNGANIERRDTLPEKNKWYTFSIDFSGAVGTAGNQLVLFINEASATGGGTYYVDNIRWRRAGYNGCIGDNETQTTTVGNFTYFNNGTYDGQTLQVVANPLPATINTSSKVLKYVQAGNAGIFSGAFAQLDANIDFKSVKTIKTKVLMDHIGKFTMKVEVFGNAFPPVEITLDNTKVNEWEELTFNFATVADNATYDRLTVLVDITSVGAGSDVTTYFDDIVIGAGACTTVGVFTPGNVQQLRISPNPASEYIRVENFEDVARLEVFNVYGQRISTINTANDTRTEIGISQLPAGVYTINGFSKQGVLVGNAKFVKQ